MPTPRELVPRRIGALSLVALAATLALVAAGGQGAGRGVLRASASGWRGLVGAPRPQVTVGQRMLVVLRAPSLADRVARAGGRASDADERRWTAAAFAAQQQLISDLGAQGVQVRPEFRYARVLNGFSAAVDARGLSLLERAPQVAGVYPIRAAYPASVSSIVLGRRSFAPGMGHRPDVSLPGFDGRGVTIALLDTGVDRAHPFLRGRVQEGIDVVGGDEAALPEAKPDDPAELERHGTEMAGILVGAGGPSGLAGVAPGASVLPIRVAGWQRAATGAWAVFARTDQALAGLDRAVDPNGDGDAHDAARIALVALAEPYAAFADGPLARAALGALRLDTLVVAPAGNDGPAGPAYGSISGPGGAPAALTVGAVDLRRQAERVRVVLRAGLRVELDRILPLAGAVPPDAPLDLEPARPTQRDAAPESTPALEDFFDRRGFSLVAGRAALVPPGADPDLAAEHAARAGAAAVVLYGGRVPAGALGLDEDVPVPVVSVPVEAARALAAAVAEGASAAVSIGRLRAASNSTSERVALFSSRGLAFDGALKPDLAGPGIAVATAEPGRGDDGAPRFGTVNGSSAAAATVAGAAALLAQARPGLEGAALKSVLVGSARPLPGDSVTARGAGLVDVGAAAAAEFAAQPATLTFASTTGSTAPVERTVVLLNLSSRTLRLTVSTRTDAVSADPARVSLGRGRSARLRLTAQLVGLPRGAAPEGAIKVAPAGGRPLLIPWAISLRPLRPKLLGPLRLSARSFRPSDTAPAVVALRAGRVLRSPRGDEVQPVLRLDVELWTATGKPLGLLARLRDLLPGRYAFGLTGRGPGGAVLKAGPYRLRLVAFPAGGGLPSRKSVRFTIK